MAKTLPKPQPAAERHALRNDPSIWDFLYGAYGSITLPLRFDGDPHTWSQVKERATALGMDPAEVVRFALYQFLEGNSVGARARLMAYREWCRTRPVQVFDEKGARLVPADQLLRD